MRVPDNFNGGKIGKKKKSFPGKHFNQLTYVGRNEWVVTHKVRNENDFTAEDMEWWF